jgi:hypothetical protein
VPLTGSPIGLPSVECVDELRQRVAPIWPRRVILRQQQAGCVRGELPERDLANIAALLQLDDVFGDGIVASVLVSGLLRRRFHRHLARFFALARRHLRTDTKSTRYLGRDRCGIPRANSFELKLTLH